MVQFRSNELVWAKWRNGYWPAVALDPDEWKNLHLTGLQPKSDSEILVYWLGSSPKTAMQLVPLTQVQHFLIGFAEKFLPSNKINYRVAIKAALKVAGQSVVFNKTNNFGALAKLDFGKEAKPVYVSSPYQWKLVFPKTWHKKMVDRFFHDSANNAEEDSSNSEDKASANNEQRQMSESCSQDTQNGSKEKNFWDSIQGSNTQERFSSSSATVELEPLVVNQASQNSSTGTKEFNSDSITPCVSASASASDTRADTSEDKEKVNDAESKEFNSGIKVIEINNSSDPCVLYNLNNYAN